MDRPLLICLSATRNYGWVTRAFCQANSQWADHIIIVDQMSTDDTKEICAEYSKVILLDDHNLSYSETRRCKMALDRAREIQGDKILVYLAIDEVLPANWMTTNSGKMVLQSNPTDMFVLDWANLLPSQTYYSSKNDNMYRVFHDDGVTPYDNQNKDMHTHCLPYCNGGLERKINDFPILHFGIYNVKWNYIKNHYYVMLELDKNNRSIVSMSRYYNLEMRDDKVRGEELRREWLWSDFNIFELVDTETIPPLLADCQKLIMKNGIAHYAKINMWDEPFMTYLGVSDPRSWWMKIIHAYLRTTKKYSSKWFVRAIDKVLKQFI